MDSPDEALRVRVERLLGKRATSWRHAAGGYTPAERWIAGFEDGSSAFVKAGSHALVAGWLRDEYRKVYSQTRAPFLPELLAWDDDGEMPLLVLEDLSAAYWPPPWRPGDVSRVLAVQAYLRGLAWANLPTLVELGGQELYSTWRRVRDDPVPFLGLGLASQDWLDAALPALQEAADSAVLEGEDVVHFDMRSDNLCFANDRCLLVDWNHVCRGNGEIDLAAWLPSLHSEGGPAPEALLPDAPHWAALVCGYFASNAGLPPIPNAPRVRQVQLSQLRSALPWAVRALGLPPLDGPAAP
jgi:hypothetical protein